MTFKVLDTKIAFGNNFPELMEGVEALKGDGWNPLGTPTPALLSEKDGYGMMQIIYRDRSKD